MQLWLSAYYESRKLFLLILQQTQTEQVFWILSFSVYAPTEYITVIDERRNYNCVMRQKEIQWATLLGLHYDEFRATASGIFPLYPPKKSLIIVIKSTETIVFKKGSSLVDQRNQH